MFLDDVWWTAFMQSAIVSEHAYVSTQSNGSRFLTFQQKRVHFLCFPDRKPIQDKDICKATAKILSNGACITAVEYCAEPVKTVFYLAGICCPLSDLEIPLGQSFFEEGSIEP